VDIIPEQWAAVSALLDEALDLAPQDRQTWLGGLGPEHATLIPIIQRFLEQAARLHETDFAATLPGRMSIGSGEPADERAALDPGDAVGPYRLVRLLGSGGMAVVWLAERADGQFSRTVALKVPLRTRAGGNLAQRFVRERDILARLEHAHIGRFYDAGVAADGTPYIAMEYVEGLPIDAYCDALRLDLRARLDLFRQVLDAVQYAHAHLVIHRDLKPSNILVTAGGDVRLLDFGIARLLGEEEGTAQTQLTELHGRALTPRYASPEQVRGEALTTATDIYSLGVVLYELLTGVGPYKLKLASPAQLEMAIAEAEVARPSSAIGEAAALARGTTPRKLARQLRGDLDTILLKALRKDVGARYGGADAFADDLRRYADAEPVQARPDAFFYRMRKFVLRNRTAAAAAFAVVLALGTGLGFALWQAKVSREQAALARAEARTTKAVEQFLTDIFRANSVNQRDPLKARQTTARELLDIGAAKIASSLADAPAARAEVLRVVSDMYEELGLKDRAAQLAEQRVDVLRTLFGPDDAQLVGALVAVSAKLQMTDRSSERGAFLREALRILDRQPDSDPQVRVQALRQLAIFESDSGDPDAIAQARSAVAAAEAAGAGVELVLSRLVMGNIQSSWGDDAGAEATLKKALELAAAEPKLNPRQRILLLAYLGDAQRSLGKLAQAEANFLDGLDRARKMHGEDHMDVAQMEFRLARLQFDSGRTREGLHLMEITRARVVRIRGAQDRAFLPRVLQAEASMRAQFGDPEAALPLIDAALQRIDAEERDRNQDWGQLLKAEIDLELGRMSDAASALEAFDAGERSGHQHSADSRVYRKLLAARTLVATQGWEQARVLVKEGLAIANGAEPSFDAWNRLLQWGELALDTGDPAGALAVAQRSLDQISASPAAAMLALREQAASLLAGRANLAMGNVTLAIPQLRRSIALAAVNLDAQRSAFVADAWVLLAQAERRVGQTQAAQQDLGRAQAILDRHRALATYHHSRWAEERRQLATAS